MKIKISLFALVLLFAPTFAFADIVPISETLSFDTTWHTGNIYLVSSLAIPNGVALTVEPGVIVKSSQSNTSIIINGTLNVQGTASEPVYFTSLNDTIGGGIGGGSWAGFSIGTGAVVNLDHANVRNANLATLNNGGTVTISNSTFENSSSGIFHSAGVTNISTSIFQNNQYGISGSGTGSVSFTGNTFSNNSTLADFELSNGLTFSNSNNTANGTGRQGIFLLANGENISNQTLSDDSIAYVVKVYGVHIPAGKLFTVKPGVILKFEQSNASLAVDGTLDMKGAEDNLTRVTSIDDDSIGGDSDGNPNPTPNYNTSNWGAIVINSTGTANIDEASFDKGGVITNNGGVLNVSNSTISNSGNGISHIAGTTKISATKFRNNSYGFYASGTGTISLINNTFENESTCSGYFEISNGLTFTNSGNMAIGTGRHGYFLFGNENTVSSQTFSGDNIPYIITVFGVTIPAGKTFTAEPGAIFKFEQNNASLNVNGTFDVEGTAFNPVNFTSFSDDSVGGDSNGNDSTYYTDSWAGISLKPNSIANFNHTILRHGGYAGASLNNEGGILTVSHSEISDSSWHGVIHTAGTTNISQSSIKNSGMYGIINTTTIPLNAKNNYWGSLNGPTHASNPLGTGDRVSDYVDFEPYLKIDPTIGNYYSNVMFLPGMEASRLYRPDYNGGTNRLWEPNSSNDAESLTLGDGTLAKDNDIYVQKDDVIDEAYIPLGLGPNIYKSFIESMNTLKNDDHLIADWSAVPYDWRLDYNDILTHGAEINGKIYYRGDLAATSTSYIIQELKRLASTSRTGKVTIIAHSNGGLLAKALTNFLGEEESSKLIDKIVMVAVPQLGTPQAIGSVLNGHGQSIPNDWFYPFLSPQNARAMAQNMPVAYNLLPSEEYFHYVDDPVITISSSTLPTWTTAYGTTTHSTIRLDNFMADVLNKRTKPTFDDVENPEIVDSAFLQRANAVHAILDRWTPPAGIQLITIAGWGEETVSSIGYKTVKACTDASCYFLGDKVTETISHVIDGDGTVVEPSAQWANGANSTRYWVNLGDYNFLMPSIFATKHADILEVPELRTLVKNILLGESQTLDYISTNAPQYTGNKQRLHFTLHSPLTLEFYDTLGKHVGYSATTNSIEQNIPGVQYERYGEVQWISIPKDMAGRLVMHGTDSGSFALDTEEVNGNDVLSSASFEGVPSSINTVVTMNITPSQSVTSGAILSVDENGDGTADTTLTAKSGEIVVPDSLPPHTTTTTNGTLGTNSWYTSNVSVTFSATDDGSGVKSTSYSTDKGISWNSVTTLTISTEGTTTIQYYSTDSAGNKEATSTLNIKIDKTAPEAKISVDATTKDLKIQGVDMSPTTVVKNADNSYVITDLSGHTTKLFFQKTFLGKLLTFAKLTGIQYDSATKITLPSSSFLYLWNPLAKPPVLLSQTITVKKDFLIEAVYDKKKNQTTVLLKKKGVQIQKQIFTGLRIEKLTVEKGVVGYEI